MVYGAYLKRLSLKFVLLLLPALWPAVVVGRILFSTKTKYSIVFPSVSIIHMNAGAPQMDGAVQ